MDTKDLFEYDDNRVRYMAEMLFVQYSGKLGESLPMQDDETQNEWLRKSAALEFLFGTVE